ncbi:metallophosphoesterase [Spirochaetota bacterium]
MRSQFIIFLTVILSIFTLIHTYIFISSWRLIRYTPVIKWVFLGIFLLCAFSYPLARTAENFFKNNVHTTVIIIGSFWIAFMIYYVCAYMAIDIIRLLDRIFKFLPSYTPDKLAQIKLYLFYGITVFIAIIVLLGHIHSRNLKLRKVEIQVAKSVPGMAELNIVLVSDIHLGYVIKGGHLKKIVETINKAAPDIVLITGDFVDEDACNIRDDNISNTLLDIKTKYGIYAITGNHEFFSGKLDELVKNLEDVNIIMLRDQIKLINGSFYLIGREDITANRFRGYKRKPLHKLLESANKDLPLILMDHQPNKLEEAEKNGVDLQVSGHTHGGQLFPANLITSLVFEKDHGYYKKGNTQYYISSGAGTWGPPVRIGSSSEVVHIKMKFKEDSPQRR